jgi:hypothetical protein
MGYRRRSSQLGTTRRCTTFRWWSYIAPVAVTQRVPRRNLCPRLLPTHGAVRGASWGHNHGDLPELLHGRVLQVAVVIRPISKGAAEYCDAHAFLRVVRGSGERSV